MTSRQVRQQRAMQNQGSGKFDHDDIYLKTPLGQALEEAMD